jgi:hypothetical protein
MRINMNEQTYPRRGLIRYGLTLVGGIFFLGAARSSFGATTTPEPNEKKPSKGRIGRRHCIEGERLGAPVQALGKNKD